MQVRPYQQEAIDGIHNALSGAASTILVMATGTGKTITFSMIADDYMKYGRVMILAHRAELIYQAQEKLLAVTGVEPDIEMGEQHIQQYSAWRSKAVVSTVQTQISGMGGDGRKTKFNPDEFSLLIIDECHHSTADSYREVIDYYRRNTELKVLGVTATPDRADEKALGQIFETVAYEYGILEGIRDGYLVPITQQAVYVDSLDYSSVRTTAGDLNGGDLARVLEFEESLHGIASPAIELIGDRKTLVFAASIAQAERLCEIFNRHRDGSAKFVEGKTPKDDRRRLFKGYAEREFQILVNVGVATEGFDDPSIEVVVMARPTKSRSLYAQMAGRGTRVLPGVIDAIDEPEGRVSAIAASDKPRLEIIDFVGNSGRHKLVTSADILGGDFDDAVVELAKRKAAEAGRPVDMVSELERAEREIAKARRQQAERAEREKLVVGARYTTAKINPFDVLEIMPQREHGWDKAEPATPKQVARLERWGIGADVLDKLTKRHAHQLIGTMLQRFRDKKASIKQVRQLKKWRHYLSKDPQDYTKVEAGKLMQALHDHGWTGYDGMESVIMQEVA